MILQVSGSGASRRPMTNNFAPRDAKRMDMERPRPEPPPDKKMARPCSKTSLNMSSRSDTKLMRQCERIIGQQLGLTSQAPPRGAVLPKNQNKPGRNRGLEPMVAA